MDILDGSKSSKKSEEEDDRSGEGEEQEDEDDDIVAGAEGSTTWSDMLVQKKGRRILSGRGITLNMLMNDGILTPGNGLLTIDYLGTKFVGDLLVDGKIRWQQTQEVFSSPSAWAIHCKKLLNPDKKSGCGWSSIKYRGKKLDSYKLAWFRKHRKPHPALVSCTSCPSSPSSSTKTYTPPTILGLSLPPPQGKDIHMQGAAVPSLIPHTGKIADGRSVVQHCVLGNKSSNHDLNTMVVCTPFSAMDRIQPFTVTIATNCMLLIDFHCHLTRSEVVGYLGGTWDVASHNLAILQAFPCRCRLGDKENSALIEEEIRQALDRRNLTVVGWYHSHPACPAQPTIKDIESQMEYQIAMKGSSDSAYTPCLGLICSPYDQNNPSMEAEYQAYWVMPPPEYRPYEYGCPMKMYYTVVRDSFLTQDLLLEMRLLAHYYRGAPDIIDFKQDYIADRTTYWDKLQVTLKTKLPRDLQEMEGQTSAQAQIQAQALTHFWDFIKGLINL